MDLKDLIGLFSFIVTTIVLSLTGLWAYLKYVLERGFLPPVHFYATAKILGKVHGQIILDIKIHLHNLGSSILIARNIRFDLRYLRYSDVPINLFADFIEVDDKEEKVHDKAGRLIFPNSVMHDLKIDSNTLIPKKIRKNGKEEKEKKKINDCKKQGYRGFLILEHDTFVQAGVNQAYNFVTMVPDDAICCLMWSSFQYAQKPGRWQMRLARECRKIGLIHFTLEHIHEPHTVEDVFWIAGDSQACGSGDR